MSPKTVIFTVKVEMNRKAVLVAALSGLSWSWLLTHLAVRGRFSVMIIRKTISIWLVLISFSLLAIPQDQQEQKRPPSTPEERKRFLALVHKLEKTPLDQNLNSEVAWALKLLEDIPDVNVSMCFDPLGPFTIEKYRYDSKIRGQFVLGMGAYLLEHPQKAADNRAQYLAGVESALRAYKSIVKAKPEAKSRGLDDLVTKQDEGQLADFVRDAGKGCDDTNQT